MVGNGAVVLVDCVVSWLIELYIEHCEIQCFFLDGDGQEFENEARRSRERVRGCGFPGQISTVLSGKAVQTTEQDRSKYLWSTTSALHICSSLVRTSRTCQFTNYDFAFSIPTPSRAAL